MISLEVRDMPQEAKFLRVRKFQDNSTTFDWLTFLYNFMACSEVLTPQINWNPPSAKNFHNPKNHHNPKNLHPTSIIKTFFLAPSPWS